MSITLAHPLPAGHPTDPFGWRPAIPGVVAAQLHTGQDWAAPAGTPILAAHSGRVNRVWWDAFANGAGAGGNMLQIGSAAFSTRYAHLSGYAVKLGDEVKAGQVIGFVGRTGAATGDHLHFELLIGGQFVNPVPYLTSTPTPAQKENTHMKYAFRYTKGGIDYVKVFEPSSGWEFDYTTRETKFNNLMMSTFGFKEIVGVDESIYNAIGRSLAAVRQGK